MVKQVLNKLGLHFVFVEMGEVDIMENITTDKLEQIRGVSFQKSKKQKT